MLTDLAKSERKVYSQHGEDGVIEAIFNEIGTTNRYFVEIGCGDNLECNTANLRKHGWAGLAIDGECRPGILCAWITAENVNEVLGRHGAPFEYDFLSIDIDGNDYWVWKAMNCRPRVVVVEYNRSMSFDMVMPYHPFFRWDGGVAFGASLSSMIGLGRDRGYDFVYHDASGTNAFFVRQDCAVRQK